jgi:hypothetical protein
MSSEPRDFYKWIQNLTTRSVAEQTRALQRYNELVQRVLRGELSDPQLREDYARFARDESTRYASDLAQLSLGYYSALLELGRSYSDRFYDQMLHRPAPAAPASEAAAPARPRQVTLALTGAAGQAAAAAFVIENKRPTPAEISFLVSEFIDVAGGRPFSAPLQIQPAQLALGPQAEAAVMLRLPLLPEHFVPGHQYAATVVVRGYDELELILSVRVNPGDEASPPASPPNPQPPAEAEADRPAPARRARRAATGAKKNQAGAHPRRKKGADSEG